MCWEEATHGVEYHCAPEHLAHRLALDNRPPAIQPAWAGPTLRPFLATYANQSTAPSVVVRAIASAISVMSWFSMPSHLQSSCLHGGRRHDCREVAGAPGR